MSNRDCECVVVIDVFFCLWGVSVSRCLRVSVSLEPVVEAVAPAPVAVLIDKVQEVAVLVISGGEDGALDTGVR